MKRGNIFSRIADHLPDEQFETLAGASGKARIERIVSDGHASPQDFWYDQEEDEWVILLKGGAGLRFEGQEAVLVLKPGDWIEIPAHSKHRVEWTDPDEKTVWLGVFY
ncbi:MAG: cupin domain-containing protein [Syntrophobacteraceae bacterium]